MSKHRIRNTLISLFVIVWSIIFHYESIRYFYLQPHFEKPLPKIPLLFPPAGWIMFFQVGPQYGFVQVYGIKNQQSQTIDPHDIFRTRTIMFDNIHRNILSSVSRRRVSRDFCRFLYYRFPYFDEFVVTSVYYPDVTKEYFKRSHRVLYHCQEKP